MYKRGNDQIVETPTEARQGFLDRPVLVVLLVSTVLTFVILGALFWKFAT